MLAGMLSGPRLYGDAMSMEIAAWNSLYHAMTRPGGRAAVLPGDAAADRWPSPGRTGAGWSASWCSASSAPCWRWRRPVLAGRVVDAIVAGGRRSPSCCGSRC